MLVDAMMSGVLPIFRALVQGIAAALILFAGIEALGKISGGHFNPAVTIAMLVSKNIGAKNATFYMIAQILGGIVGVLIVNITFYDFTDYVAVINSSEVVSAYLVFSEFVCTFMLVAVVFGCVRSGSKLTSLAVGALVGGMIMATASTFYANPAVDIARVLTDAACGIAPLTAVYYIIAAVLGAIVSAVVMTWLYPAEETG
jgi:glycerol uptake facilitator-like aquaporin